ncbi:MAG: winged helix-turn-helix transcriptional regulator [Sphaerochaeta sp.]|nr:winged helix-turn-helix transcriptional regulator [Sphaerochaeta sp.]
MHSPVEDCKALSDNTRYDIVRLLLKHECCVGCLSRQLGVTISAISQHLKVLREVGLVVSEKRGYYTHYIVDRNRLVEIGESVCSLARIERERPDCTHLERRHHPCNKKEELECISSKHTT